MKFKNQIIYECGQKLAAFHDCNIIIPVRINFYLQKNIQLIRQAYEEIEYLRLNIGALFGERRKDGSGYDIFPDKIIETQKEISDLFSLEQDLPIHMFKLSDFDGIELTYQQMSAIMFMIEED